MRSGNRRIGEHAAVYTISILQIGGWNALRKLTGKQKAAVLLLSLGDNIAADLIKQLHDDEVEEIFFEIANLGKVTEEMIDQVSQEFYDTYLASGYIDYGDVEHARELLEKALGQKKQARSSGT